MDREVWVYRGMEGLQRDGGSIPEEDKFEIGGSTAK